MSDIEAQTSAPENSIQSEEKENKKRFSFFQYIVLGRYHEEFNRQLLCVFPILMIAFGAGLYQAFIKNYVDAPKRFPLYEEKIPNYDSWIKGSSLIGIVSTAIIMKIYGRRYALVFLNAIFLLGFFLFSISPGCHTFSMGFVANLIVHESLPMAEMVYIIEIVEAELRGFFTAFTVLSFEIGIILGRYFPTFREPSHLVMGIWFLWPSLCILMLMAVPESPQWLLYNNQPQLAREHFFWLYQPKKKNKRIFKALTRRADENRKTGAISNIFTKSFLKPMVIILTIFAVRHCVAILERNFTFLLVGKYLQEDQYAKRLTGIAENTGPIWEFFIIYRLTRKWLFIGLTSLPFLFLIIIRLYGERMNMLSFYLPFIFVFVLLWHMGADTIPQSLAAEYFPPNIREFGCAIVFLHYKYFTKLILMTLYPFSGRKFFWYWWLLGVACIIAIILIMPKSDVLTLPEMEKNMQGKWKQIEFRDDKVEKKSENEEHDEEGNVVDDTASVEEKLGEEIEEEQSDEEEQLPRTSEDIELEQLKSDEEEQQPRTSVDSELEQLKSELTEDRTPAP